MDYDSVISGERKENVNRIRLNYLYLKLQFRLTFVKAFKTLSPRHYESILKSKQCLRNSCHHCKSYPGYFCCSSCSNWPPHKDIPVPWCHRSACKVDFRHPWSRYSHHRSLELCRFHPACIQLVWSWQRLRRQFAWRTFPEKRFIFRDIEVETKKEQKTNVRKWL